MKQFLRFILLLWTVIYSNSLYAQKNDQCAARLAIASDNYNNGKFADALNLLEEYQKCIGIKNSDYYKLRAKIFLALDSNNYSLQNTIAYVKLKTGNYVTDADPIIFKNMVQYVVDSLAERQISSVSKRPEDIDFTPASVVVVKSEDMAKRGYGNLVDLLSDLPGFDISRTYSTTYANIYQGGFRQDNTERTLFMIDGVEENDVWSNIAYISRQYPLTSISEVEIIYGPASTLYGARAFAGTINIITKSYKDLVNKKQKSYTSAPDSTLGVHTSANLSYGSYNTRNLDITVGAKTSNFTYQISGAYYESNERDLDFQNAYGYGPSQIDKVSNATYLADLIRSATALTTSPDTLKKYYNTNGKVFFKDTTITLANGTVSKRVTLDPSQYATLINNARAADKAAYNSVVNGSPVGYSNHAADWFLSGKVHTGNFEAGFKTWKLRESFNYYQSLYSAGTNNGSLWVPINTSLYTTYNNRFDNITFSNLNSYQISGLDKATDLVTFGGYLSDSNNPSILNLISPGTNSSYPAWYNKFYYYKGEQFRSDNKITYNKNRLSLLAGFEYRYSQLQGDYLTYTSVATAVPVNQNNVALAQEQGVTGTMPKPGGNQYNTLDLGLYSQATYTIKDSALYATAGGRFDYNRINTNAGFGQVFSPKLALVAAGNDLVYKLIYSQGIQNPSQSTKFSTTATRVANPTLQAERIKNLELVVLNKHGKSDFNWDLTLAYSSILDAVSSGVDPDSVNVKGITYTQNLNNGQYTIFSGQYNFMWHPVNSHWDAYFNATYTWARQTANSSVANFTQQTIADIAPVKFNAGTNYAFKIYKNTFNINLRSNFVGNKPEGPGTTESASTGVDNTDKIPAYVLFNSALTYRNLGFERVSFQFVVNNLLNTLYYDPGARLENANFTNAISGYVPYVVQRDRNFLLTLKFDL